MGLLEWKDKLIIYYFKNMSSSMVMDFRKCPLLTRSLTGDEPGAVLAYAVRQLWQRY